MHSFTNYTASTFRYIQGSTTLVSEQTSAFKRLIASFIVDVGVVGPLTPKAIVFLDPTTHVSSGLHSVSMHQVRDYLCGLAGWVEEIIDEADTLLYSSNCSMILGLYLLLPLTGLTISVCFAIETAVPSLMSYDCLLLYLKNWSKPALVISFAWYVTIPLG